MANEPNEPEVIREQMQETRTALTEKLDTLQQKVADTVESITTPVTETVQTVKEAVSDTVESVKETVSGTVETVKETFDLSRQVERHPWPMMLGSFATGFLLGKILPSPFEREWTAGRASDDVAAGMSAAGHPHNGFHRALDRREMERELEKEEAPRAEGPGLLSGLADKFSGELDQLKGMAIAAGVGLVRDLITQSVHGEMGDRIKGWMDHLTESLGGKPFREPLVNPASDSDRAGSEDGARQEPEGTFQEKEDLKRSSSRKGKSQHGTTPRW